MIKRFVLNCLYNWRVWAVVIPVSSIGLYVANFYFQRWVHYKLSYQTLVQAEIVEMVKPQCLK
jgi:hypothetical protein